MKKFFSLAVAAMLCSAAWAGHMTLRTPEAEMPSRVIAAQTADTMQFLPGVAYCRHMPAGDQADRYYMVLSFLTADGTAFPQMQLHMLVTDTMAISHDDNILVKAAFYQSESAGGNAIDADVSLKFLQYDTVDDFVSTKYDIVSTISFEKHEPICCKYRGYVIFISDATNTPYVPLHEGEWEAIEHTIAAPAAKKVLRDGQLVLVQGGREYSPMGQVLK